MKQYIIKTILAIFTILAILGINGIIFNYVEINTFQHFIGISTSVISGLLYYDLVKYIFNNS